MDKLLLFAVSLLLIKLSSCEYEDHNSLEFKVRVKRVAETKSFKMRKYNRKKFRIKKIKRTKKNRKIKRTKKNRKSKTIKKDSKNKRFQGHGRLVDDKCLGRPTNKENKKYGNFPHL